MGRSSPKVKNVEVDIQPYYEGDSQRPTGFIVIYTGDILTMPGLPKAPSAMKIDCDNDGNISGLF